MISIIITSWKEPRTIGKAIESFLNQKLANYEIIVSAPDEETLSVAKSYSRKNKRVKVIKDKGNGKPSALNKVMKIAKGEIIILSDGDVYVGKNSVERIVKNFSDKSIGAVSGRVISTNDKNELYGYWAYLLTEGVHKQRVKQLDHKRNVLCSGYLYGIRRELFEDLPEEILADDAFISLMINKKGFRTTYEYSSEVYVKYPTNLRDWIKQKKRTSAKFYQLNKYFSISKTPFFKEEITTGLEAIGSIKSFKDLVYFMGLIIMRTYIWFRVFFDFNLWKRAYKAVWERVESTK